MSFSHQMIVVNIDLLWKQRPMQPPGSTVPLIPGYRS